ncbi:MAG: glycerol-3-phosphate 1-O-acyltransferase PlsY [Verrucomicrobia bacterium]|nr:glycerol-3-phosphate 1-O-acyltransferase PlsY [Verrucomicrobiota bacterium]
MMPWLLPVLGFLIGSIPFGLLIAKARGVDIRKHGSGNIGATNVMRTLGKGPGISCLLLDLLKGFVPVVLAINLVRFGDHTPGIHLAFLSNLANPLGADQQLFAQTIHVLTALAAILGHNYSPWIGFKGGKGIATSAGALLGLMPAGVVILILVFIITLRLTHDVSAASIAAAVALPLITVWGAYFHGKYADGTWNKPLLAFAILAGVMAIWRHRSNIARIRSGTENKSWVKKKTT